ncbi:hypothetical protein MVEN_01139300 [Mycena venus]|uniref:Alpha-type protein kinase domain-containing protein n=1 Tax=Mycena venus TaxID=2733690 RepID=A0A8H6YAG0_9AGAR|nr:hypothetical protein MVEN_01139300 [Mycena venus]
MNSAELRAALELNPRPVPRQHCTAENCNGELGQLLQALNGTLLENWARWFQKCKTCPEFYWHNPPTALGNIPHEVQVRFTISLMCQERNSAVRRLEVAALRAIGSLLGVSRCSLYPDLAPTLQAVFGVVASSNSNSDSGAEPPADPSNATRTFARALNENYAQGYLTRHLNLLDASSRLDAAEKSKSVSDNTVHVILFHTAGKPAQSFFLVNKMPGKFVPVDHSVLAIAIRDGLISYLESPLSKTWCVCDARVPISSSRDVRIILRVSDMSDEDCVGLNVEISRLLIEVSDESDLVKKRSLLALSGCIYVFKYHESTSTSHSESTTTAPVERNIAPLRFPLTWACDMEVGLAQLRSLRQRDRRISLQSAFEQAFPKCAYKSQTVYKHLKIYDDAVKLNIISTFSSLGQAPGEPTVIEISDDDDSDLEYDIMHMRKEVFTYSEGILQSGSVDRYTPTEERAVLICDKFERGHKMKVHLANYATAPHGPIASVAFKRLLNTDTKPWGSREMATWTVGSHLAECQLVFEAFKTRAVGVDLDLAGVDILPTFLFSCEGRTFISQPWECGVRFSVNQLDQQNGAYHILSAFSHFTYQTSNQQSVYVDFQGFRTISGYRVFDSQMHIRDTTDATHIFPAIGCRGAAGVDEFVNGHVCGRVCNALGLNSLPLTFSASSATGST